MKDESTPPYPPLLSTLSNTAVLLTRGPLLAVAAVYVVHDQIATRFQQQLFILGVPRDMAIFLFGTLIIHTVMYFGSALFYTTCNSLNWLSKHKLPRTKRMLPSAQLVRRTMVEGCVTQFVIQPLLVYALYTYVVRLAPVTEALPPWYVMWKHFAVAQIFNEVVFYCVHRTMHEIPFLYRNIHKKHHNYVGTISIAAEFSHPVEDVLSNALATAGYLLLSGAPVAVWLVFLVWRLEETFESHSGYCFKDTWLSHIGLLNAYKSEFHDFHHTENKGNFGILLGLDMLLHSSDAYMAHLAAQKVKS